MRMNEYMRATANVTCFVNAEAAESSLMQERRCRGSCGPRYGGVGPASGRQCWPAPLIYSLHNGLEDSFDRRRVCCGTRSGGSKHY